PAQAAFTVNRALLVARELHLHRQTPPSPWRTTLLAALTHDQQHLRSRLHP
ncbi:hypothetical protein H3147_16785, partial [Streptomyces sp. OF8]|nr:hypothetical protein [Streptomyces alkaliterrae]